MTLHVNHRGERVRLVPLTSFEKHNVIFCRGCDEGRSSVDAARDDFSIGGIDIYCSTCCERMSGRPS